VQSPSVAGRYGYRDRVTLSARHGQDGWRFGLMRRDELIAIPRCPVHTPRILSLVATLGDTLPGPERFPLAFLNVAGGQATLIIKARDFDAGDLARLQSAMPATGIEGLWVHCHPSAGRRLFGRSGWHLVWGAAESADAHGCVHGPTAFQQLLPALHADSLARASDFVAPAAGTGVADLYCGIGTSLRTWIASGADVLGIELAGGAVECARRNAPGAVILRGTCAQRLPQLHEWWSRPRLRYVAYLNPPRSGLDNEVLRALADTLRPARVAYLSCSAGTLARDVAAFVASGYAVDALVPYDFFPGTHHVECLALLTLGGKP
jgi:tRNA/tmRNA/rRNA uracil-C5-methylase (TrmA/RlmC/RlmD family)